MGVKGEVGGVSRLVAAIMVGVPQRKRGDRGAWDAGVMGRGVVKLKTSLRLLHD